MLVILARLQSLNAVIDLYYFLTAFLFFNTEIICTGEWHRVSTLCARREAGNMGKINKITFAAK